MWSATGAGSFRIKLFDLIDDLNSAHSSENVESLFVNFLKDEGFETVGARAIGNPFNDDYLNFPEIYNGPEELRRIWHKRRYVRNDPTVLRALTTQSPFLWTQHDAKTPIGKRILYDAADFGLKEGIACLLYTSDAADE